MKNTYLFIKSDKTIFDLNCFDYTDIHFWNVCNIYNEKNYQNIYFYCKNIQEIANVIKDKNIPHITFMGNNIFSSFYLETQDLNFERFWFPQNDNLTDEGIEKFLKLSNIENIPIAIVFNPLFQPDINYKDFLDFIKKINSKYKNPLFFKDLNLQENEIFSLDNKAIIDDREYFAILGLFGDYYSLDKPTQIKMNLGILKSKECVICEFSEICKERGLGFIKIEEDIKSCIGIKLFQQN